MTVRFAKLAQVTFREFSLDHASTFWVDLADPRTISNWMGNVPGKYAGQSGYTTGFGRGRMPFPKYVAPNWRGPGNDEYQTA